MLKRKEIVEALVKAAEASQTAIQIQSVRPTRIGNQIATVAITKQYAEMLEQKNKMEIVWHMSSNRVRVDVLKCLKCQSCDHKAKESTSITRIESCYNCGKEGHHANLCQEETEVLCLPCNKSDVKAVVVLALYLRHY